MIFVRATETPEIPRHLGAVADDVGETPQPAEMEDHRGHDRQHGEDQNRKRQWPDQTMLPQISEPLREPADRTVLHEEPRQTPEPDVTRQRHRQRAQSHDRDEVAIEQTERRADAQRHQDRQRHRHS